jgi:phosphatidylethanolamine/phosphatidyl-N-methylethanolamine N-methyltransferase
LKESEKPQRRRVPVYDRFASRYDHAISPLERLFLARLRAETLALLPVEGHILEIGAGTGLNFPFYPEGSHGVASELSCEMLKVARGRKRPESVHLLQNSAERLPFMDATFDAAFATLVFCSVASPLEAFKELRRVVRPGGLVALLEHVRPKGIKGYIFDGLSLLTVALFDDHFNRRTADEASRAGFELLKVERRLLGIINIILMKNSAEV